MSKVRVTVEGYGRIKVRIPKRLNKDTVADTVAETVRRTVQLVATRPAYFHPALGYGAR